MSGPTISSLPNELLIAIAVAGQEDNDAENWETQSTAWKAEWILSQLSQRFRDVIVGASELWALIETDVFGKGSVEILELYLERSRASKISVTLRESPAFQQNWAHQIVPHLDRIKELRIALRTRRAPGLGLLDPFCDVAAPHLQHFEVAYITNKHHLNASEDVITIFSSGAPRLRFLKIDGFRLPDNLPLLTASLTHLELRMAQYRNPQIDHIVAIAAQCPLLVRLHLDITFRSIPHNRRFHIPPLKFLHISISETGDPDFLSKIIDSFDTPALTELVVDSSHGDQIAHLLSLTSLPRSSFPALTSLSFAFVRSDSCPCETDPRLAPNHTILSPPAIFPALSHLTLINQCYTSRLIGDILGPASEPWPLLKAVTLFVKEPLFAATRNTIDHAVKPRRERGQALPKIQLSRARSPLGPRNWNSADGETTDCEIFW
ncbi:hypothetical protein B0H14DRAFT_242345 [Mycena olivaceomarginata]|nr:hypothetical protein B0H14DRAFT_242345 [Mycena olivaceomarginata]